MKTDYEAECLAQPKGQLSSWPSVGPYTTLGPILSQLQNSQFSVHADADSSARRRRRDTREVVPLLSRVSPNPREQICTPELKNNGPQKSTCDRIRTRGFRHKEPQFGRASDNRRFRSPNYSACGAPERNRCYQTPATLLVLPLAPAAFARSAHLAPLTTLRPRWGLALFEWLRLQQKGFQIVKPSGTFTAVAKLCKDGTTAL